MFYLFQPRTYIQNQRVIDPNSATTRYLQTCFIYFNHGPTFEIRELKPETPLPHATYKHVLSISTTDLHSKSESYRPKLRYHTLPTNMFYLFQPRTYIRNQRVIDPNSATTRYLQTCFIYFNHGPTFKIRELKPETPLPHATYKHVLSISTTDLHSKSESYRPKLRYHTLPTNMFYLFQPRTYIQNQRVIDPNSATTRYLQTCFIYFNHGPTFEIRELKPETPLPHATYKHVLSISTTDLHSKSDN